MEIAKVEKKGTSKVTDLLRISYNITTKSGENPYLITGNIIKNDVVVGFFNINKNGVLGFSLNENNELTCEEIKGTFQIAIDDCYPLLHSQV